VLELAEPGLVDTVLSYCHYSLADSTLAPLLPDLTARGLGVISASPLCMGLLTRRGPPEWHPAPLRAAAAAASDAAAAAGADISELALRFAVREPRIATTLVGMATPEQVRANVATVVDALAEGGGGSGGDAALAAALGALAPVQGLSWSSGLPENN
jgi:L-galactose dehydrogenase